MEIWLSELLSGLWKIFLQPTFYLVFLLAAYLGVSRVKKERSYFHVRAQNAYLELKQVIPLGTLLGILASIVLLVGGVIISYEFIAIVAAVTLLFSLTLRVKLLSPSFVIGGAFFLTLIAIQLDWEFPSWLQSLNQMPENSLTAMAVLLGITLIVEGILVSRNGVKATSPQLAKSKRGQVIGIHTSSRVWLVPLFLLVPGDAMLSIASWWPILHAGNETFSIILVPLAIGFNQSVQGDLPKKVIRYHGRQVILLGVATLILAIATYWLPLAAILVVALAIVLREVIAIRVRLADESKSFFFSKRNEGVLVLGILPGSPADQMGILPGEVITKINGIPVMDATTFYDAVSSNRAQCKLEVLNVDGHVRFCQRSLYEGTHHELGVLSVQKDRKRKRVG